MKFFHTLIFLLVILVGLTGGCNAKQNGSYQNVTSTKNITIDPIGNHTVGEIFYINGTTNIGMNDSLDIIVYYAEFDPSGRSSGFHQDLFIRAGDNNANFWSCNASAVPGIWTTQHPPGELKAGYPFPAEYEAVVTSNHYPDVKAQQFFYVLPNEEAIVRPTTISTKEILLSAQTSPAAMTVSPHPSHSPTKPAGISLFQDVLIAVIGLFCVMKIREYRR